MQNTGDNALMQFNNFVGIKFQLYNSLFTSLPFHKIEKTGILLSLFQMDCEESFEQSKNPIEIVDGFVQQNTAYTTEQEKIELLFRFTQYAERQVVLFDALEDAAFSKIHDMNGQGSLKQLELEVNSRHKEEELKQKLEDYAIRLVLTAHPTQFYPDEVLGIITDLSNAVKDDNVGDVNMYLQQLGKTPFLKKQKPTPYDEAVSLMWYMEHVFYTSAGNIMSTLKSRFPNAVHDDNPVINMGFWPGGDRDGNPFVTTETTLHVAATLNNRIIKCYHKDLKKLRHRLTFKGVLTLVTNLEEKLFNALYYKPEVPITTHEIIDALEEIKQTIINDHDSLFLSQVDEMLMKVRIFGLYFASLDIRQNSTVHTKTLKAIDDQKKILPAGYYELDEKGKIDVLLQLHQQPDIVLEDWLLQDTLDVMKAIKIIQRNNGEKGCHRYIISHNTCALNVIEVYALLQLVNDGSELAVDIVPLFEMIEDLQEAGASMKVIYENETYRAHLKKRGDIQHVMLGFSDGTKDGGYLMANWSIYKAKENLTTVAREHGIEVVFFDGRGGPPARGGGKTHQFYASLGSNIAGKEIQITIQGQTISSSFGNVDAAGFNMEKLLHAGIYNSVLAEQKPTLTHDQEALMLELSEEGYKAYVALKNEPEFVPYLENVSPLRFYADANIGSRPAKRNEGEKLNLDDLRAIPFVGAWSQLKQNLTGYYGVGRALQKMEAEGRWQEVKDLYENSLLFKTMIDNCEMAMMKSFFPLTAHLATHPQYGAIWNMIHDEYELSKTMTMKLGGTTELMEKYPVDRLSVSMRERIVLPLTTIQQYALSRVREMEENKQTDIELRKTLEKLIMRCSFGIINAGRNSA